MAKRVHELAKELNVTSKILLDKLNKLLKIEAKNHMTLLEDDQVDAVLRLFGLKKDTEPVKKEEPKEEVEPQVDSKPDKKSSKKEVDKKAQEIQVKKADKKQVDKQKEKAEVKKEEKAETKKKEKPEEEVKNLNIKLDEADQLLIENFLDNEEATNKVEKIGSKNRQIKSNKVDKNNTSKTNKSVTASQQEQPKKIVIPGSITVKDLAEKLCRPASELIKKLLIIGIIATINKELDYDTASLISMEFGVEVELENIITDEERLINDQPDDISQLQPRPPIVVVMGHVDHGKTSLLDAIKETNVIEKEAGGITQHIGAYSVNVNGRRITFLDTPGHEAFTALRARGAQVTDIAVLVVAADDGIMPQTIEAINHAKAAEVSIIIAINKIDKPDANPERVKQELAQHGLVIEEWGGDTIAVEVSAKKRQNIDQLLEMILLCADMLDLKANPNRLAKGTVIESKLDKGRGPVATVLVQNGTLGIGDTVMAGTTYGRIRAMIDDKGIRTKKAKPSTPVEIQGLSDVPKAGDTFYAVEDERLAKQVVERKRIKEREINIGVTSKVSLDQLFNQIQQGKIKDLNIIIKADVQGSVEALKQSLEKVSNEEVRVRIIHGGVGAINESDVMLASASNAIIIGFNVRPEPSAVVVAERESVDVRLYRIIYNAIEDVESAMKGLLDPQYKEVVIGHVEVRNLFKMSTIGTIAGCYVIDGKILRNCDARLIRDGIVVYEGKLSSLRRFKEDVKEVASGYECGITLEKYNDIKEGDIIEGYIMEEIKR